MFFFLVIASAAQERTGLKWKKINSLAFNLPETHYTTDSICFFHALVSKKDDGKRITEESTFSFPVDAKPLDLYEYWEHKGDEKYDVLLTKVGYVLEQPIDFFTKERLSDTAYISKTMPEAKLKQKDSIYHISVGFGAPEIDYTLSFYTQQEFEQHYPKLRNYFKKYDGLAQVPELIVVQHNYHYGKVMFQSTSKMSISISRYFHLNDEQTLTLNYTLNYIQNLPPSFIGGSDFLVGKIKDGIKALIDETQYICRMAN